MLGVDISRREAETAKELGLPSSRFMPTPRTMPRWRRCLRQGSMHFGRVDAVLNVAGIGGIQPLGDITIADYERVMAIDLRGVMLGTKHAVKAMLVSGGGVIPNWASAGGLKASRLPVSTYSAAKAGIIAFTKAAAVEYGPQGIRANAICPGRVIVTELARGRDAVNRHKDLVEALPLKRAAELEEVTELACFLAPDRAPSITGAVIPIGGGQTAVLA